MNRSKAEAFLNENNQIKATLNRKIIQLLVFDAHKAKETFKALYILLVCCRESIELNLITLARDISNKPNKQFHVIWSNISLSKFGMSPPLSRN